MRACSPPAYGRLTTPTVDHLPAGEVFAFPAAKETTIDGYRITDSPRCFDEPLTPMLARAFPH
jgi:hypothetical protein